MTAISKTTPTRRPRGGAGLIGALASGASEDRRSTFGAGTGLLDGDRSIASGREPPKMAPTEAVAPRASGANEDPRSTFGARTGPPPTEAVRPRASGTSEDRRSTFGAGTGLLDGDSSVASGREPPKMAPTEAHRSRLAATLAILALFAVLALAGEARAGPAPKKASAASAKTATASVDLNTATAESLMQLPGIGKKRAERILARRAKRPFRSTQELAGIKGIGPKLYRKLRPLVKVGEVTTTR